MRAALALVALALGCAGEVEDGCRDPGPHVQLKVTERTATCTPEEGDFDVDALVCRQLAGTDPRGGCTEVVSYYCGGGDPGGPVFVDAWYSWPAGELGTGTQTFRHLESGCVVSVQVRERE